MFVDRHNPPYKAAGAVFLVITAIVAGLIYMQFRGDFTDKTELTMLSARAGLVVEPGAKVTYNGVEIGRVGRIGTVDVDGTTKARLSLDVDPDYIEFIPANVVAEIQATTVFGNKYVSFSSPDDPSAERISSSHVIDESSVSTEFNTLFETVMALAEQVDPIKLNQTLTATAEALTGLGDRFGESLTNGNTHHRRPQRADAPDPRGHPTGGGSGRRVRRRVTRSVGGLENAVTTARTFNEHRADVDAALMAALGFADSAADSFDRGGPYFVRGAADLMTDVQAVRLLQPPTLLHAPELRRDRGASRQDDRRKRLLAGDVVGHVRGRGEPVHLSRQPAAGERQRRSRGSSRLLAEDLPRVVARAVSGDGHRCQHRALQPHRIRPADVHRIRVGPPDRRVDDQPVTVDINFC